MKKRLNLEYLNTFLIAAETGKLNATAELTYRSHSAVSTQIKKLEEQIDAPLFIRSKNTLILTKAGETLVDYAQRILALNDAAFNSMSDSDWGGDMTLAIPTDYSRLFLQSFYPKIQEKLPHFNFSTVFSRSREIRKKVDEGKIQFAIAAMEPEYGEEVLLWEEGLYWVCSKQFEHEPDAPIPIALFSDDCIINNHSLYCLKKTRLDFQIRFTSTVMDNIADCVRSGLAVSLLPESMMTDEFQVLSPEFLPCAFTLKMGCIWQEKADTNIVNTLIESIKAQVKQPDFMNSLKILSTSRSNGKSPLAP